MRSKKKNHNEINYNELVCNINKKIYLCFSILHEQTTAKARSKLVG